MSNQRPSPATTSYKPAPSLPKIASVFPPTVQTVTISLNVSTKPPSFSTNNNPVTFKLGECGTVLYQLDAASAAAGYYVLGFFANTDPSSTYPLPAPPQPGGGVAPYANGHAAQYLLGQACADGTSYAIANFNPMTKGGKGGEEVTSILDITLVIGNVNVPFDAQGKTLLLIDPQDSDTGPRPEPEPPPLASAAVAASSNPEMVWCTPT